MPFLTAQKILKSSQLKTTSGRLAVLDLFITSKKVLSHGEIETALSHLSVDRVTIYRILDCFVNHQIIHKVSSGQAIQLFALNQTHSETVQTRHAHFVCNECDSVACVDLPVQLSEKAVQEKLGYTVSTIDITLHGTCSHCSI